MRCLVAAICMFGGVIALAGTSSLWGVGLFVAGLFCFFLGSGATTRPAKMGQYDSGNHCAETLWT
jgi:hypothetical protein